MYLLSAGIPTMRAQLYTQLLEFRQVQILR
jgi:hypothetical protein